MSTRTRTRSTPQTAGPPLVARLDELAVTSPRCAPSAGSAAVVWWAQSCLAGAVLLRNPQWVACREVGQGTTFHRPGRGSKAALMRWLYLEALRRSDRPVVVLDEPPCVEPIDVSSASDVAIAPLAFGPTTWGPPTDRPGEW